MRSGFIGPIKEHGPHSKSSRKPLNSSYFEREAVNKITGGKKDIFVIQEKVRSRGKGEQWTDTYQRR